MAGSPLQDIALGPLRSLAEEIEQPEDEWLFWLLFLLIGVAGLSAFALGLGLLVMCCKCARYMYGSSQAKELKDLSIRLLWVFAQTLLFSGLAAISAHFAYVDSRYVHKAEKLRVSGITLTVAGAALYIGLTLAFAFYRRQASQLVEDLSELLGDDPWKELIRVQAWTRCARDDYPRFHGLVADVMSSLWKEWSRRRVIKDEELQKAADEILRRIKLVRASKIVDAEFLADSDDPFGTTIREYCLEHCNMRMLLLGFSIRSTDMRRWWDYDAKRYSEYRIRRFLTTMPARPHDEVKRVLGLLEEGRVLEAMHALVPWFGDAVAPDIAATAVVNCEQFRSYATALALTLWKSKFVDDFASEQPCARDVYSACLEEFPALFESFLIIMQDSRVNKFVNRAKSRDCIVSWVCDNRVVLKALQEKRYEDIVKHVEQQAD